MIIAVAHTKGGVGKSTIAWNIATALKESHNVELIDLDFQRTLTYINEYRAEPLIVKNFENDKEFKAYIKADNDQRISIIDVGGFDSDLNRISIIMADLVITPVSDAGTELLGLIRFEKILKEISNAIDEKVTVNILLNNINPQKKKLEELQEYIDKNEYFNLFESILRTRADYGKALDDGLGVIEYKEASKAGNEMKKLIEEIEKIIKDKTNG